MLVSSLAKLSYSGNSAELILVLVEKEWHVINRSKNGPKCGKNEKTRFLFFCKSLIFNNMYIGTILL